MKPIGTIAILIAMLACMWSTQAQYLPQLQQNGLSRRPVKLSPELVDQIKLGMTIEDVYETVNASPSEENHFQGKIRKDRKKTMLWYKGYDGKFLGVLLSSNAVVSVITNY